MRADSNDILWNSSAAGKSATGNEPRTFGVVSANLFDLLIVSALFLLLLAPLVARVFTAEYDEAIFLDVARNIQRLGLPLRSIGTNGIAFLDHTPLYLYLLSLYANHSHTTLVLERSVTVIAALAAVILTYRFGLRLGGRRTAFLAAFLLAINPFFLVYAFFVRMEIFMLLALLAGFYLVVLWVYEGRDRVLLAAGTALAVAVLFKEFAVVGTVVATGFVAYHRRGALKQMIGPVMLTGAPSVLAIGGWLAWSWKLAPVTFAATMSRWLNSAVSPLVLEPRMGMTWSAWAAQLGSQLLGPGLALGLVLGLGQWVLNRGRRHAGITLLLAYTCTAIALSFFTSLKEPRHLIGVLPPAALITGSVLVTLWDEARKAVPNRARMMSALRLKPAVALALVLLVVAFAGPVRPPLLPRAPGSAMPWLAPAYSERLVNERLYRVLALTGARVASLIAPGETVTIVHQAPVIGYYADRPYRMLYTLPLPRVTALLDKTDVLVWDATTFLAMTGAEIDYVKTVVAEDFSLSEVVDDGIRSVSIFKRKVIQ